MLGDFKSNDIMIKTILLIIVLFSLNIFSQQIIQMKVTYREELNLGIPVKKHTELFFNDSESFYVEKENDEIFQNKNNTKIKRYGTYSPFNKTVNINLKKDSIYTKTSLNKKILLIHEKVKNISWKIHNNTTDKILGFSVAKATGYFRGRIYTVWFTDEIPVKFGPWKLQGLPGLILEAKDNLNQVFFIAEKIEYLKENDLDDKLSLKNNNYETISLRNYNEKLNTLKELKVQQIISRLPKGSKVISRKFIKNSGIETKFEWEEKTKQD